MKKLFHPIKILSGLFLLSSFFCSLTSCRKLVTTDFPDFDKIPVVNGTIKADSILNLHISLTDKVGGESLQLVENADVILFEDNIAFDTLLSLGEGLYQSRKQLNEGHHYICNAYVPGYETITANTSIPDKPEILDIKHIKNAGKNEEGISYPAIKISFKNITDERHYYQIVIQLNQYDETSHAEIHTIADPVLLNEGLPLAIFSNESIHSETYTMHLNYSTGSYQGVDNEYTMTLYPFVVELRDISYDYYMYLKKFYLYEQGRYPEDITTNAVTAFNLYSNIENGYGIFAGYASSVSDTINPNLSPNQN